MATIKKRESQNSRILRWLEGGNKIDFWIAVQKFNAFHLHSRISDIRRILEDKYGSSDMLKDKFIKKLESNYKEYWIENK